MFSRGLQNLVVRGCEIVSENFLFFFKNLLDPCLIWGILILSVCPVSRVGRFRETV